MAVDMLFQSYIFVFLFLPVSLTGFYFIGNRWGGMAAKLWLIVMSLWFYGSFRIEYVFLLLLSIAFNYGMAGKLRKRKRNSGAAAGMESGNGKNAECCKEAELGKRTAKRILAAGIAGNLALLFFFKYMNFFIGNWNAMGGRELSLLHIALLFIRFPIWWTVSAGKWMEGIWWIICCPLYISRSWWKGRW